MKQIVKSIIIMLSQLRCFTTAVYAWFSQFDESNIQPSKLSLEEI